MAIYALNQSPCVKMLHFFSIKAKGGLQRPDEKLQRARFGCTLPTPDLGLCTVVTKASQSPSAVVPKLFWSADHLKYFSAPRSTKY